MPDKGIDIEGLLGRSEAYNQIDASMGMGNLFNSVRRLDEALKSMDEILGSSGIEEFHSLGYELHTATINKLETDLEVLAEFPQRAVSEMIENLDTKFAYAMKEAEEGISSVRIDEISLKGSSNEELVTKPSELCKRIIHTIEERKQADIEELCLLLSYEKDLTGSEKKHRDIVINRIFEEGDIQKMRAVTEKLSKNRICKWTHSERSFIEQVLRYGAEKEKTVYQETNELVNKLCMDEYWLREDGYFTGQWYASEEKRNEAAEMLAREITITGGYDLLHAGKQEEKEKRMHAEKMQLIQVLANAFRTGTLDEKTLSELEIVYTKAGKDFSMENMTLTSEGMKLLVENEKHILLQKSGFKLELGWGEVIDGLLLLGMGAVISGSTLGVRSNAEMVTEELPKVNKEVKIENTETSYAQSSERLAYQGGSDFKSTLSELDLQGYNEFLEKTNGIFSTEAETQEAFNQFCNGDFKNFVKNFDFSTEPNKAYFWSGNKDFASELAQSNGCRIMENTQGGNVIDNWEWLKNKFPAEGNWGTGNELDPQPLWKAASKEYAKGVSGKVTYVNQGYEGSIWLKDEATIVDRLLEKEVVTEVEYYNKEFLINKILDEGVKGW